MKQFLAGIAIGGAAAAALMILIEPARHGASPASRRSEAEPANAAAETPAGAAQRDVSAAEMMLRTFQRKPESAPKEFTNVSVRVRVENEHGDLAAGAVVESTAYTVPGGSREWEWAPDRDVIQLRPGRYYFQAARSSPVKGYNSTSDRTDPENALSVFIPERGLDAPVTLKLRPACGIRGHLSGFPYPESELLIALREVPRGSADDVKFAGSAANDCAVADGKYWRPTAGPGVFLLSVYSSRVMLQEAQPILRKIVTIDAGIKDLDLDLPKPAYAYLVECTSVDGERLNPTIIRLSGLDASGRAVQARVLRMDCGAGRFLVVPDERPERLGDPPVTSRVERFTEIAANDRYHGWSKIQIDPSREVQTITFNRPRVVTVRVAGYDGSGYEGELSARIRTDEDSAARGPTLDVARVSAGGSATYTAVQPGNYQIDLVADSPDGRSASTAVASVDHVTVAASDVEVVLTPAPTYSLTVEVPDERDALIELRPSGDAKPPQLLYQRLENSTRAVFRRLREGDYEVRVGRMRKTVHIPAADVVVMKEK